MSESVGLEASPGPSLSLEEAIRDKYCCPDAEETVKDGVNESALGYKPGTSSQVGVTVELMRCWIFRWLSC